MIARTAAGVAHRHMRRFRARLDFGHEESAYSCSNQAGAWDMVPTLADGMTNH